MGWRWAHVEVEYGEKDFIGEFTDGHLSAKLVCNPSNSVLVAKEPGSYHSLSPSSTDNSLRRRALMRCERLTAGIKEAPERVASGVNYELPTGCEKGQ